MDIIKTLQKDQGIWDLFTCKLEYNSHMLDQYCRFPFWASGHKNIFEPSVSKFLIEQGYYADYPDGKPFAICLTHDIDLLYKTMGNKIYEAIGKIHTARSEYMDFLKQIHSKKLPWWNFSDIMALEDRYDAKSSFYFMVQDPGDQEYNYDIEDCETVIGELSDRGMEIGLHGGHAAYNDWIEMRDKKKRLEKITNKNVVGYRNHYLRLRIPDTFEYLQSAGFHYDSTLGYADCIGFRNGMCHPFRPYNLTTHREIDILEIPLNIMDSTLDQYMKMDLAKSWEMTKLLIDTVEMYHGTLTILWHNTSFCNEKGKLYEKILNYCYEKNAWMTNGREIAKWVDRYR